MWGAAVKMRRCSSARAELGTSKNSWSNWYCLVKSRKPNTWLGGVVFPACWAKVVRTSNDKMTTSLARFNLFSWVTSPWRLGKEKSLHYEVAFVRIRHWVCEKN